MAGLELEWEDQLKRAEESLRQANSLERAALRLPADEQDDTLEAMALLVRDAGLDIGQVLTELNESLGWCLLDSYEDVGRAWTLVNTVLDWVKTGVRIEAQFDGVRIEAQEGA